MVQVRIGKLTDSVQDQLGNFMRAYEDGLKKQAA